MANVTIVVATDQNGLIGCSDKNTLPWYVPGDLKLFRQRTINHAVIMGRKTWESLPKRPLVDRRNIVVSRQVFEACIQPIKKNDETIAWMCGSLRYAIELARSHYDEATGCSDRNQEVFLIGGAQIYQEALNQGLVNKIIMSRVVGQYEGDIFFPHLPANEWEGEVETLFADFDVWVYKKKPPTI